MFRARHSTAKPAATILSRYVRGWPSAEAQRKLTLFRNHPGKMLAGVHEAVLKAAIKCRFKSRF